MFKLVNEKGWHELFFLKIYGTYLTPTNRHIRKKKLEQFKKKKRTIKKLKKRDKN